MRPEQKEFLHFRKSLDKALRDDDVIGIDYEYDLGKKDVMTDTNLLLSRLVEMRASLAKLREMMK